MKGSNGCVTRCARDGLYNATLRAAMVPHPATHQMDVVVHITPGVRARIGPMQLTNGTEFGDAEIIRRTKIKAGNFCHFGALATGHGPRAQIFDQKRACSARVR